MEIEHDDKISQKFYDNTLSDEQQNENNNFNNDERSSDEDELTRKIRAIPILPRIPKLKKVESSGEIKKQTLEHRSILQRKDSVINPDQSLKWPTVESFGGSNLSRNNNRKFSYTPHNNGKKFNNSHKSNSSNSCCTNFINNRGVTNNLNKNQTSKPPTTHLTYSSFKRSKQGLVEDSKANLTSEEKFDQIFKKKDDIKGNAEQIDNNETTNQNESRNDSLDDFGCFNNNILNIIAKTPCKTIEDRYRERMQKGLHTAQPNSEPTCSQTDSANQSAVNKTENLHNEQLSQEAQRNNTSDNIPMNVNNINTDTMKSSESMAKLSDTDLEDSSDENKINNHNNKDKLNADKNAGTSRKVTFNCPDAIDSSKLIKNKKLIKKKKNSDAKNDDKCSKSSSSQDKVVSIMKDFLKPYYSKQKISKDQYKEIMRKSVPKFSRIKSEDIKVDKVHTYAMKLLKMLLCPKNNSVTSK